MGHDGTDCISAVCTCGRHKLCRPITASSAPLEAHTEYCDNFQKFPLEVRRGRAAPQELTVGGDFYGNTESREKFVPHPIPPRNKLKKEVYIANDSPLDSVTTQRQDYRPWPGITPPKRKEREQWVSTSGNFDGATTTKTDYVVFPLPPHYVRRSQPYLKSDVRFEGVSTQAEDYKRWEVTNIPSRRKASAPPTINPEDRDFKSTTAASYIGHQVKRELVRAPQNRTTDGTGKFEAISTTKEAYKTWELPPRYQRHRAQYMPNSAGFDGHTTYTDTFQPKKAERYVHPTPTYVPNDARFEGTSTHKTDFLPTGVIVRSKDFRPRNEYVPVPDDRDFVSTTRGQHSPKPLPQCQAADWIKLGIENTKDGHIRLAANNRPTAAAV